MSKRINEVAQSCRDGQRFCVLEGFSGDVGAVQFYPRVSIAGKQRARGYLIRRTNLNAHRGALMLITFQREEAG